MIVDTKVHYVNNELT